jgi:hypothetical protein
LDAFFITGRGIGAPENPESQSKLTLDAGAILVRTQYFVNLSLQTFWSCAGCGGEKWPLLATSLGDRCLYVKPSSWEQSGLSLLHHSRLAAPTDGVFGK